MGKQQSEESLSLQWDKLLRIKTTGRDDSMADQYRYPYEPTPYSVLERLVGSGYISKRNVLLDYGCGKGRVDFYLSYQTRCRTMGIEYDPRMYERALSNQQTAVSGRRASFVLVNAEQYPVPAEVDRCYFFNPFSVEILQKVMARILDSYYENSRNIQLYFYYPSDEYVAYLMTQELLMFVDEIDCGDLFEGKDPREKILIFEIM
ncbi:SAM-dependent methyltransferase [Eubacterium sp. An11]|uniref:class I SAM-dependent methyltransferase n=1 Tax=Eubacterium sp. An11 TaxID=1965542 RepID=UPI000B374A6D|nr:class I SAM-dependent methyltransferase [Eubacterium sp. An11]OUQ69186.1 SAM-dependent methyltransferase [Eubacterium sp. An11]